MNLPVKPLPAADLDRILAQTRPLWADARGQAFFFAGGTGFVGRWLLESFVHANDTLGLGMRAAVLSRDPAAFAAKAPHLGSRPDLAFIRGDMRAFPFPAGEFNHLIHAAADTDAWKKKQPAGDLNETAAAAAHRMTEFAGAAGVCNLLFVSSGAVYGRQPPDLDRLGEDFAGGPVGAGADAAWGRAKRLEEKLCLEAGESGRCAVKIARAFTFVGPLLPLDATFAAGNFIRDALAGGPIRIAGDGTPVRSYMYAADMAAGLWTILFRGAPGRAYNLGSDEPVTIAELAQQVARVVGTGLAIDIAGRSEPGRLAERYVPDVTRARLELGLTAETDLTEALRRTVDWLVPGHSAQAESVRTGRQS